MISHQHVEIYNKLLRCQKAAKNIYGQSYLEKIAEYQVEIKRWMPHHENEVLPTVIAMAELLKDHVMGTILLMAAAVEMIESPENKTMNKDLSGLTQEADPRQEIAVLKESNRLLFEENKRLREEKEQDEDPYNLGCLAIAPAIAIIIWALKG